MYPNVRELLVSMREDDEDDSVEYYEIGQYEYIINQDICFGVIDSFLQQNTKNNKNNGQQRLNSLEVASATEEYGRFMS